MRLQDYDTGERFTANVLENLRITPSASSEDIRELSVELDELSFDFKVGQSIGVIVPGGSQPDHSQIGHPHHFRLYTLSDTPQRNKKGKPILKLCVKRCSYIDPYSGEEYRGIASNYLCDLRPGDKFRINGPFGIPFEVPKDKNADLLLIGMGTGIAPFRALVKHIYQDVGDWKGKVRLFYGAKTGLEMVYMNDQKDDFAQYYDEATFEAFQALSPRAHWTASVDIKGSIEQRANDILDILTSGKGYIYVAGRFDIQHSLDEVFSSILDSTDKWQTIKSQLVEENRWVELVY